MVDEDEKPKKRKRAVAKPEGKNPKKPANTPEQILEIFSKHDAIPLADAVYQLWQNWADFEMTVLHPTLPEFSPPHIVMPESLPNSSELEFVYPIHDYGYKFLTSKQNEMFTAGKSMCKLHYTIEKIIAILIERLKSENIDPETEVQVAFVGHESAQRKCFEVVINLKYNVVVVNYDPGNWGDELLKRVRNFSALGYGYPPEAPRSTYRQAHTTGHIKPR